jgi:invasion protein IalB
MFKTKFGVRLLLALVFCDGIAHAATLTPVLPASQSAPPASQSVPAASQAKTSQSANEPQELSNLKASGPGWISRCVGDSRKGLLECSMEETFVLTDTGQLVAAVAVQLQSGKREPVMNIRVPGGLYLPAGLNLQIDDGKAQVVPLQTCDQQGCYAELQINADLLAALRSGKRLSITCQNAARNNFVLPLALNNFADAFQKIQ